MDKTTKQKVQWGTVVAGAAAIAGTALLFPAAYAALGAGIFALGEAIVGIFSAEATATAAIASTEVALESAAVTAETAAAPGILATLGDAFNANVARILAGTVLLGGSAAYFANKVSPEEKLRGQEVSSREENYVMQEDMRKMEALMKVRMAVSGYQPAAGSRGV